MRLDRSEVLDPSGKFSTGRQVLGGIAITLLPSFVRREIDHRPQRHRRVQRMLLGQCLGRRGQKFVVIAVDLVLPVDQQARGVSKRWPVQKEGQRSQQLGMGNGMRHRALLGLDVFEIRQTLQVGPQVLARQVSLEARPSERLRLVFPVKRLQHGKAGVLPLGRDPARLVHLRSMKPSEAPVGKAASG